MCGISGIVNLKTNNIDLKEQVLNMISALHHRGPDSNSCWINKDNNVCLGSNRLAIMDLSDNGTMPFISNDNRFIISFNGEIYNFREIRNQLINKGYKFKSKSDTEIIIAGMYHWEFEHLLDKLEGMFAFVIYDNLYNLLYGARDRLGEKPFFYQFNDKNFIFASEIKSIKKTSIFESEIDKDSLISQIANKTTKLPNTIYKNIKQLKPGHFFQLDIKKNIFISERYWDFPKYDDKMCSYQKYSNDFENTFSDVIGDMLSADVEVGVFLSGGIDSSLVASYASKNVGNIKTFTMKFSDPRFDESDYASQIAKIIGSDHHELNIDENKIIQTVNKVSNIYDEPFSDSSAIPTILLSEFASKHVKVCLGGDGGDELFGGYDRYFYTYKINTLLKYAPYILRKITSLALHKLPNFIIPSLLKTVVLLQKIMHFSSDRILSRIDQLDRIILTIGAKNIDEVYSMIMSDNLHNNNLLLDHQNHNLNIFKNEKKISDLNLYENLMSVDQSDYLPNDLLVKVDRASMAYSLEMRLPFLHKKIVNYSKKLSTNLKINDNMSKYFLKKQLEDKIPQELIYRKKQGFAAPIHSWLRSSLKNEAAELFDISLLKKQDIFNGKIVDKLWKEHIDSKKNNSAILWNIFMFQKWSQTNNLL